VYRLSQSGEPVKVGTGSMSPTIAFGNTVQIWATLLSASAAINSGDQWQAFGPLYRLPKENGSSNAMYWRLPPNCWMRVARERCLPTEPLHPRAASRRRRRSQRTKFHRERNVMAIQISEDFPQRAIGK